MDFTGIPILEHPILSVWRKNKNMIKRLMKNGKHR